MEVRLFCNTRTAFPETDKVSFVVQVEQPVNFELKLRKPEWLKGPASATINDKPNELSEDRMHWMTIQRTWYSGDRLQIQMQMSPMVRPLLSGHSKHFAVSVGPVVLAAKADNNPSALIDPANLEKCLLPVSSGPLAYRVADAQDVALKPFYQFAPGEKYFMYLTHQRSADRAVPTLRARLDNQARTACWKGGQGEASTDPQPNLKSVRCAGHRPRLFFRAQWAGILPVR